MASLNPSIPLSSPLKQSIPISQSSFPRKVSSESIPSIPVLQFSSRQLVSASVAFNPSGNYDLSPFGDDDEKPRVEPPMPPTKGRYEVILDDDTIKRLDLSPFSNATGIQSASLADPKDFLERTIGFTINYTREDEYDTREWAEYPDIRLWFVRLDATYPWLPVLLDWRAGELARYASMLVPHQISLRMGVVFNPEALELFVMNKVFIVYSYLKKLNVAKPRLKTSDMARMLGFGIGDELFDLLDEQTKVSSS